MENIQEGSCPFRQTCRHRVPLFWQNSSLTIHPWLASVGVANSHDQYSRAQTSHRSPAFAHFLDVDWGSRGVATSSWKRRYRNLKVRAIFNAWAYILAIGESKPREKNEGNRGIRFGYQAISLWKRNISASVAIAMHGSDKDLSDAPPGVLTDECPEWPASAFTQASGCMPHGATSYLCAST